MFCSHLAMRGAPARAIQELAGHQDLETTQRYMHEGALALDFDTAIPGHGMPGTKETLRKYRDDLRTLVNRVVEMQSKRSPRGDIEKELRSRFGVQDFHVQSSMDGMLAELR